MRYHIYNADQYVFLFTDDGKEKVMTVCLRYSSSSRPLPIYEFKGEDMFSKFIDPFCENLKHYEERRKYPKLDEPWGIIRYNRKTEEKPSLTIVGRKSGHFLRLSFGKFPSGIVAVNNFNFYPTFEFLRREARNFMSKSLEEVTNESDFGIADVISTAREFRLPLDTIIEEQGGGRSRIFFEERPREKW